MSICVNKSRTLYRNIMVDLLNAAGGAGIRTSLDVIIERAYSPAPDLTAQATEFRREGA